MKLYDFHGTIPEKEIGKELRMIARGSKEDFKILTGYGSTTEICKSKAMAIKSLRKMRQEGIIKAFLPAETFTNLLWDNDEFYDVKMVYQKRIIGDKDARIGNDGVIFVFVR